MSLFRKHNIEIKNIVENNIGGFLTTIDENKWWIYFFNNIKIINVVKNKPLTIICEKIMWITIYNIWRLNVVYLNFCDARIRKNKEKCF